MTPSQLTGLVALTRAREADTPIQRRRSAGRPAPYWLSRLGGAAALGDVAISFSRNPFAAIGANDDDDDAAAAAPAANDGARALDNNQLRGHRQKIGKSAALSVVKICSTVSGALDLARATLRSERSAEFCPINRSRCPHACARGGHADSATSVSRPTRAILVEPPGRRCGSG